MKRLLGNDRESIIIFQCIAFSEYWCLCVMCRYFIIECDLVFVNLESLFPVRKTHVRWCPYRPVQQIVPRAVIWKQQDNPSGHLLCLCKQYGSCTLIWLLQCIFTEDLRTIMPTFVKICPSNLLRTSPIWSTSLLPEHNTVLLMQFNNDNNNKINKYIVEFSYIILPDCTP
jgi:hypothetical protein